MTFITPVYAAAVLTLEHFADKNRFAGRGGALSRYTFFMSVRRIFVLISLLAVLCAALHPVSLLLWAVVAPLLFFVAFAAIAEGRPFVVLAPCSRGGRTPLPSRAPPSL